MDSSLQVLDIIEDSWWDLVKKKDNFDNYRALWIAVVARAVRDILEPEENVRLAVRQASNALDYIGSSDFETVCDAIGFESGRLRSEILRRAKGVWRNERG